MTDMSAERVEFDEDVKVVRFPDKSKLIISFNSAGFYKNAIYISPENEVVEGDELICHTQSQEILDRMPSKPKCFQEVLNNEATKAIQNVSTNSLSVLKVGSYCTVIPGPNGPIYICIPPGTPC